ncbi:MULTISPECIES: CsbD family protein [Brevibacterium]|uniref:CsbD family protein n=1 Tax=Brevibacterium aurantiacum TaxID=273384 RepID=A0A4Z0KR57_BREAU|nr:MULTISPECIES: CsbD family protein [Brevibacterium]MDN6605346.1 CsbD family protein [Brevibacterium sp.]TGD40680.1 CsbD family protein [Brevibacterium aurantiacum]
MSKENSHKAEEFKGKAKAAAGKATDDESLQAEGKADVVQAKGKEAGEKAKDAARGVANSLKDSPER